MGIFRNSAVYAASIALIISGFSFSAKAQTYRDKIEENPERAGGVYHYYEYAHYYLCDGEHLFGGVCEHAYFEYYIPHTKVCRNVSFMQALPREGFCNDTTGREFRFQYQATIYCRKTIWEDQ